MFPLRLCGGKLLVAVTRERRYGPSRPRVNDDDDVSIVMPAYPVVIQNGHSLPRPLRGRVAKDQRLFVFYPSVFAFF